MTSQENSIDEIAGHIESIIRILGENPSRKGLLKTPMRYAKALWSATQGYRMTADEAVGDALFDVESSGMIMVRDIEFYSMCEHHILPFFGTVTVAYVPGDNMIGLSKLARLVDFYAKRLQVQERLTAQVCSKIMEATGAKGVMVLCKAQHLCMKMRGVEKQNACTVTVETAGCFDNDPALRERFFEMAR